MEKTETNRPDLADDQLVTAEELLERLWSKRARPSLRWLRQQQASGAIPFFKIAGRVWFRPREVQRAIDGLRRPFDGARVPLPQAR